MLCRTLPILAPEVSLMAAEALGVTQPVLLPPSHNRHAVDVLANSLDTDLTKDRQLELEPLPPGIAGSPYATDRAGLCGP